MSYFGIPIRNGLPIGLGSVAPLASGGGSPFSPLSLFSGGAPGAWYDPSDYGATGTLFQDSAGTTPVTAVEQPVGLMLDKSQGLVLGSELVTNGDFSNGSTGWSLGVAVVSGGKMTFSAAGLYAELAAQANIVASGKTYRLTFEVSGLTSGSFNIGFATSYGGTITTGRTISANGTYSWSMPSSGTGLYLISMTAGTTASIDNISVKELAGNHAFQATSASRPVLSARYNLLERTEDLSNAYWVKDNVTVAAGNLVYPSSSGTSRYVYKLLTGQITGTTFRTRLRIKNGGKNFAFVYNARGASLFYVNLTTGATSNVGANIFNLTTSVAADGWVDISLDCVLNDAVTIASLYVGPCDAAGSTNVTVNGTDGVYVNQVDLRVANNGITQPAYQRVNTATDYDTTGFLPYLKFDGVDDSLSTNSISFTATDKMSVFAGVRKLSAAVGVISELGSNFATGSSFGLFCEGNPGAVNNYTFASSGTNPQQAVAAPFVAPITNTVTGISNISGDVLTARVNGVQIVTNTGDQGTGNYGNYPLYIGRRNNASLPFNGQLYGLIIVGKAVTAGELSSTETYVNQKTGAY